jgi:hypothetical protein
MNKEQGIVLDVLLWLWQEHDRWLRNDASGPQHELHQRLAEKHPPFGQLDLEALRSGESVESGNKFIFLKPPGEARLVLPLLHLNWNFACTVPVVRLRLCLLGRGQDGQIDIGFRFETPEGRGKHNYYHAQPIVPFGSTQRTQPPTKFPTFTLEARNPVTLLTCMLVSLYGQEYVSELSQAKFRNEIQPYINEMHWADFTLAKHYHEEGKNYHTDRDKRWRWSP